MSNAHHALEKGIPGQNWAFVIVSRIETVMAKLRLTEVLKDVCQGQGVALQIQIVIASQVLNPKGMTNLVSVLAFVVRPSLSAG